MLTMKAGVVNSGYSSNSSPYSLQRRSYSASSSMQSSHEKHEFQAETRKLLDIVTNSIYTDKEVFVRELVSNASDALEKFRYKQNTGEVKGDDATLEINITLDEKNKTITIADNGIGMSKEDLMGNLGTIARSGSKRFVENLTEAASDSNAANTDIIGQFGVGFYSSFMISDTVSVESVPAQLTNETEKHQALVWSSDGSGQYTISEPEPVVASEEAIQEAEIPLTRGSKITLHVKDSCAEFLEEKRIKDIIKKYSNFVPFPIKVGGEQVNKVTAIWTQDKSEVTDEQYKEFYKFIGSAYDEPIFRLHFKTDAPLDLKVLFFTPSMHTEKFGMGRMEPGVNLYSRKVLIESKPKDLLPEWLRFVKGVVDSEDLPLSLSREKPQDSKLLARIKDVLTRKYIRFLEEQLKKDPKKYREFYVEFNYFLKEGACQDYKYQEQIAKLLMYETSKGEEDELSTFEQYISRLSPEQKNIYYLVAPNREAAFASPYYETFKKHDREVLLLYNTIDDFLVSSLRQFQGRDLVSAESSNIDLATEGKEKKEGDSDEDEDKDKKDGDEKEDKKEEKADGELSDVDAEALCTYLSNTLGNKKVREVKVTKRLADSPCIITDHESGAVRRMLKMVEQGSSGKPTAVPPQVLEINPSHPLILKLSAASAVGGGKEDLASIVSEQLFDNALIAAGLIDDPRSMVGRLNDILAKTIE